MPDNLDNTIDDVAREMTSGSVDADFARRVSVRINDAEAVRARRVRSRAWLLVPATAGVAVLAVFLIRDRPSPSSVRRTRETVATSATPSMAVAAPKSVAVSRLAAPSVAMPREPDVVPLAVPPIEMESLELSPLASMEPIEIDAIAIERIE